MDQQLYNSFTPEPALPEADPMWPPIDRRQTAKPESESVQVVLRNEAIRTGFRALMALITVIAGAAVYIAYTVPTKLQSLEQRDAVLQLNDQQQRHTTDRIINVLEANEKRDDNQDIQLKRLEERQR